jgi:predicted transcriptional regulator
MSRLLHIGPGGPSPLGSLEQRVMDVMWLRADRCTVGDVVEGLAPSAPSYSAVKAVLANLVRKKAVTKFDAGKAKSYVATSSRAEFEGRVMRDIVSPLYRANRDPLLAHIADVLIDEGAVAEFQRLLEQRKAERA